MASPPPKKRFGASPLADFVGAVMQDVFARQGFAAVEIVTHWEDIVGPELARRSEPMRLIWPRREDADSVGTLTVKVEGPYAIELQHSTAAVMERVNRYFGWRCVGRVVIRQGPVTKRHKRPPAPIEPEPAAVDEVSRRIGAFEDEALGHSVARLGALIRKRVTRA